MKICMVGLGSIGKRHVGNLVKVLKKRKIEYRIDALRSSHLGISRELNEVIDKEYFRYEDMPNDYDVIFITNPTIMHYDTIRQTVSKTRNMFIEKPVFDSIGYDMGALSLRTDGVYYVACPLRHKSIIKYLKHTVIKNEKVIAVRIISTSYLPAWRKGVDYRNVYSTKKELGGGVSLDLIHEWDYAIELFGQPDKVLNMKEHLSQLDIDSDDISVYIAKYPNMLLEMHLDYIGQKTERLVQIFTDNKRIDADIISNIIYEYENNELISKKEFPIEDFYINEIEYFIDCLEGDKPNMNTVQKAYNTLRIALAEG